jgi:hypothetical protein
MPAPQMPTKLDVLSKCAGILAEHFSAVQIVASEYDVSGTRFHARGEGDYYARLGLCKTFVDRAGADEIGEYVAKYQKADDDGGE